MSTVEKCETRLVVVVVLLLTGLNITNKNVRGNQKENKLIDDIISIIMGPTQKIKYDV